MYCNNCGKEITTEGKFCSNCGSEIMNSSNGVNNKVNNNKNYNDMRGISIVLGILGIIGGIMVIFSPIAFILAVIGFILALISNKHTRNVVGIVLNSIGLFLSFLGILLIGFVIRLGIGLFSNLVNEYNNYSYGYNDSFSFGDIFNNDIFGNDFFGNYGDEAKEKF